MKKYLVVLMLSICFFAGSTQAATITVVNGSMNAAGSPDVQSFNGVLPDDWDDLDLSSSTDIFDATTSFNSFTWLPSSDGGTFVHAIGPPLINFPGEGIIQEIVGLTIGSTYQVNFEQSISRATNGPQATGGHWEVVFGAETNQSAFMDNPAFGIAFGWQDQSLSFTATSETQNLSFQAVSPNVGDRIEVALDGVSISAVPVPGAVWLFGSALGLLGWMRRKKVS
jgi:hypothetical protein